MGSLWFCNYIYQYLSGSTRGQGSSNSCIFLCLQINGDNRTGKIPGQTTRIAVLSKGQHIFISASLLAPFMSEIFISWNQFTSASFCGQRNENAEFYFHLEISDLLSNYRCSIWKYFLCDRKTEIQSLSHQHMGLLYPVGLFTYIKR